MFYDVSFEPWVLAVEVTLITAVGLLMFWARRRDRKDH